MLCVLHLVLYCTARHCLCSVKLFICVFKLPKLTNNSLVGNLHSKQPSFTLKVTPNGLEPTILSVSFVNSLSVIIITTFYITYSHNEGKGLVKPIPLVSMSRIYQNSLAMESYNHMFNYPTLAITPNDDLVIATSRFLFLSNLITSTYSKPSSCSV